MRTIKTPHHIATNVQQTKYTVKAGTKINTGHGTIKAERDFEVSPVEVKTTPAGNTKITWRGHRSMKTAIIKK